MFLIAKTQRKKSTPRDKEMMVTKANMKDCLKVIRGQEANSTVQEARVAKRREDHKSCAYMNKDK